MENREIKFRAWDKDQQLMSIPLTLRHIARWVDDSIKYFEGYGVKYEGLIWLQYTGLKDKNGKEIYEGDLLYWEDFADDEYWAKYKVIIPDIFYTMEHLSDMNTEEDTKIIGNIYEHPELIKQANEA